MVLAYAFPIYLGNKSSSLLILEVPIRRFKHPFGERVQPSGRKMKDGPVPLLYLPVKTKLDTELTSPQLQLKVTSELVTKTECSIS